MSSCHFFVHYGVQIYIRCMS